VPLQLQLLEAEHLPASETRKLPSGNYIRAGIEFNGIGKRVAYHLYREHPGDTLNPLISTELVRVSADRVLHLFRPLRPGQLRGQPWLTQVLIKLHELDQYDDAEVVRKKTAAMFAGFVTKNAPEDPILNEEAADGSANGTALAGLEPGTMQVLLPGEDVKFSAPADVGATYETFMRVQLRSIAAGMGITYEQLTGDLTGVNYSSIRAGLLEFRRRCEQFQAPGDRLPDVPAYLARLDRCRRGQRRFAARLEPRAVLRREVDSARLRLGRSAEGHQGSDHGGTRGVQEPRRGRLRAGLRRREDRSRDCGRQRARRRPRPYLRFRSPKGKQ
jgi:hypothetical protein